VSQHDAFARIVATLDAPMTIVTATDGSRRAGCLVGFETQCSMHPRRWLVCISKANATYPIARAAAILAVHLLRADQRALAELFGSETGYHEDKFRQCTWRPGPGGTPILSGCDWIAGRVVERVDAGDHVAHIIDVTDAAQEHPAGTPGFGFQAARGIPPGNPP
jgi:flavin reductase (DIM6/NTAB) family NADH-FMN oxidoreductase RutF